MLLTVSLGMCACGNQAKGDFLAKAYEATTNLEYDTALSTIDQALLAGEDMRELYRLQGICFLQMGRYDEAASAFESSLQQSGSLIDTMDVDLNFYLAKAYEKAGKYPEAATICDHILAYAKENQDAYELRGTVKLMQDDFEGAKADFDKALAGKSLHIDRLERIYEVLDSKGYKDQGQIYLQNAIDRGAKTLSEYDKGRLYYFLGEYETARELLEKSTEPGDGSTYFLGKCWEALGEYNYAASVYQSYLQQGNKSARIENQLAICQMNLGDYDTALTTIQTALEESDDVELKKSLRFNQIVAYEYKSEFGKAKAAMTEYLASYPDDEKAQREYEFLKTRK